MFKKLLSNLAFNPSLIGEVSFYAKRLHNEAAVRRTGFGLMVMAMLIQMFAVISPPQSSLQASPSTDLINGGFSTKDQAVSHCRNNTQKFKVIMEHFGITCNNIADSKVTTIAPRDHGGKLYSMGRLAYGVQGEMPVKVPSVGTLYVRHFWSLNKDPSYRALQGTNKEGETFYILFDCGNLVSIGVPDPPKEEPPDVCPNKDGLQTSRKECDVCPNINGIQLKKSECDVCPNREGQQEKESECDVCPDRPGQQNVRNCDVCPDKPGTQSKANQCDVCPNRSGIQISKDDCDVCPETTGTQNSQDQCDVCPDRDGVQTDENSCDVCPAVPGTQNSESDCDVCLDRDGVQSNETECKPCEDYQSDDDLTACLAYAKTASNVTQGIQDANNTSAKPGDVIEYTLRTTNSGNRDIEDFVVNEAIADVLDYAEVVDLHGGTKGEYDVVSWPAETIKAGATSTHKVTVKIKAVIPSTPVSSSDPKHFDLVMTNVYGNAVNINLPGSVIKQTEIITKELPNTGPGTSLVIGFSIMTIIGYFLARSQLLAKELDIVRVEFGATGGY